jgi:hypothetical protein
MREVNGEWVELTEGKKCRCVFSYPHGDWMWKDEDKHWHFMRKINGEWIELTEGKKCRCVWSYPNGDWDWRDEYGGWHEVKAKFVPKQPPETYIEKLKKAIELREQYYSGMSDAYGDMLDFLLDFLKLTEKENNHVT